MAANILINRDEGELLVDLLEHNYQTGKFNNAAGRGCDLAADIRELFGMDKQPKLIFEELKDENG